MIRLLIVLALALGGLYYWQTSSGHRTWTDEMMISGAAIPIDGDSLRVNGREIRLKGLDAPEYDQTCQRLGQEVPCGKESTAALRKLVARAPATCIGTELDRYHRLLAQCRVLGLDIGAILVREGHAVSFSDYLVEEAEARNDNRGLWSGTFEMPQEWRRRHPRGPSPASPALVPAR